MQRNIRIAETKPALAAKRGKLAHGAARRGGGVSGIPGYNAAREIRRDWKRL
jgi:hypothetical protein